MIFVISYNLINHFNYPLGNSNVEELIDQRPNTLKILNGGNQGIIYYVFNYKDAYKYIRENNIESETFSVGVNYGIMPEIIHGYSLKAINILNNINVDFSNYEDEFKNNNKAINIANFINDDTRIQNLLLGFTFNKRDLVKELENHNWCQKKVFANKKYGSKVILLKRNKFQCD